MVVEEITEYSTDIEEKNKTNKNGKSCDKTINAVKSKVVIYCDFLVR